MSVWLIGSACLASALVGGVFFAFSSFVLPALGRIPAPEGLRAMQRINIDVFHWSFVLAFFGTPALCLVLLVQSFSGTGAGDDSLIRWGCAVYLVGSFLVTGLGNVPLNKRLAKLDPEQVDAAQAWSQFAGPWVAWNHLRTLASLLAAALFLASIL